MVRLVECLGKNESKRVLLDLQQTRPRTYERNKRVVFERPVCYRHYRPFLSKAVENA